MTPEQFNTLLEVLESIKMISQVGFITLIVVVGCSAIFILKSMGCFASRIFEKMNEMRDE